MKVVTATKFSIDGEFLLRPARSRRTIAWSNATSKQRGRGRGFSSKSDFDAIQLSNKNFAKLGQAGLIQAEDMKTVIESSVKACFQEQNPDFLHNMTASEKQDMMDVLGIGFEAIVQHQMEDDPSSSTLKTADIMMDKGAEAMFEYLGEQEKRSSSTLSTTVATLMKNNALALPTSAEEAKSLQSGCWAPVQHVIDKLSSATKQVFKIQPPEECLPTITTTTTTTTVHFMANGTNRGSFDLEGEEFPRGAEFISMLQKLEEASPSSFRDKQGKRIPVDGMLDIEPIVDRTVQSDDREVQREGLQSMASLIKSDTGCMIFDIEEAVADIASLIEKAVTDRDIQLLGCRVLALLARCKTEGPGTISGIQVVQNVTLRYHNADLEISSAAYRALFLWSQSASLHPFMMTADILSVLQGTARAHEESAVLQAVCCILVCLANNQALVGRSKVVDVGTDVVLAVMIRHDKREDKDIHDLAFKFLEERVRENGNLIQTLVAKGAITALANCSLVLCANGCKYTHVWMLLLKLVPTFGSAPKFDMDLLVANAVAAFGMDWSDAFSKVIVCRFLVELGTQSQTRKDFFAAFSGDFVAANIRKGARLHLANYHLQSEVCQLLTLLTDSSGNATIVGWLGFLIDVLKAHAGKASRIHLDILHLLERLVCDFGSAGASSLAAAGFATCLMDSMSSNKDDAATQNCGCRLISNLCEAGYQSDIIASGGVPCLISALEMPSAQETALNALSLLLSFDPKTGTMTPEEGVSLIVAVMQSEFSSGCVLLRELLSNCPRAYQLALDNGAVDVTLKAMTNHLEDRTLQLNGGALLRTMMCPKRSPVFVEVRQYAKDRNGLNIVVDAILKFSGDKEVDHIVGAAFGYMINPPELGHAIDD